MKVLLYNFALPNDGNPAAGGVGVYTGNLADALRRRGIKVVLLSSGNDYSPWSRKPAIAFSKSSGFPCGKIINSPVIAPAHDNFFSPDAYLHDETLDTFPALLRKRFGGFDVLHFQNIEGVTLGFLRQARRIFPEAKMILSAHNYSLVCPQVNLWKNERVNCVDYKRGHACVTCIPFRSAEFRKKVRAAWWLRAKTAYLPASVTASMLKKRGLPHDKSIHDLVKLVPAMPVLRTADLAASFRSYRETNVSLIASVFDHLLAVSDRTRQVLLNHGVGSQNLRTSYIGSAHVEPDRARNRRLDFGEVLHLAYFGYTRRDKGFYFLLRALEQLPEQAAKRVAVTFAAKTDDLKLVQRIGRLGERFSAVNLINGYSRQQIAALLANVDLGVVPPMWEDNLPQVAIEFVASGVPILTSDLGGACEIARNPDFVFTAASIPSFHESLGRILSKEVPLASFWAHEQNIRNFDAHLDELIPLYDGSA